MSQRTKFHKTRYRVKNAEWRSRISESVKAYHAKRRAALQQVTEQAQSNPASSVAQE